MIALPRPLRAATLFLGNLFAAVVGTTMIDTGITSGILGRATLSTMRGHCLAEDLVSAIVASGLGYFAYYKLKSASAMWVWVVGFCWFGQQVLRNLTEIDRMYFIESSYRGVTPTMKMVRHMGLLHVTLPTHRLLLSRRLPVLPAVAPTEP
jgi:hypothetical protein